MSAVLSYHEVLTAGYLMLENTTDSYRVALERATANEGSRLQLVTYGGAWASARTIEATGPRLVEFWTQG